MAPRNWHKYGAKRTVCLNGHNHPSMVEAIRCDELYLQMRAKVIVQYSWQPQIPLGPDFQYRPDFHIWTQTSEWYEEVKSEYLDHGVKRPGKKRRGGGDKTWRRNLMLWGKYGPAPLHIRYRAGSQKATVLNRIEPGGNAAQKGQDHA